MAQTGFAMYKLASQGFCCSQILLLMGLNGKNIENPDIVRAMAGLCVGVGGSGRTLGVLTGGACLSMKGGQGLRLQPIQKRFS